MAGNVVTNSVQLGDSATASQNFVLKTNADGTAKLARGADGSLGDILTVDASGKVTLTNGSTLQSGTAIATTSGTSHDFTGIPSWVKRITIMMDSQSTNGSSNTQIQIGDSGGVEITGYTGAAFSASATYTSMASGFLLSGAAASGDLHNALATLVLLNSSTNTWCFSSIGAYSVAAATYSQGNKSLSGTLDRIRLTTVNGTDTFDAGSINIMWE